MTDLKVYKNGKLVPKDKRQKVIDDAHRSRENPWGKPVNVNPTKINNSPKFGKAYSRSVTRYGDPK